MDRLCWEDYFMIQALWARTRSPDSSTRHGAILVDKYNRIIGQGYNGWARGVDHKKMPKDRPEKYPPILHSEENCIANSTGDLEGSTLYVSGPPCTHCWANIIQHRIKKVVYGPIGFPEDSAYADINNGNFPQVVLDMLENQNIEVVRWIPGDIDLIRKQFKHTDAMLKSVFCLENEEREE